jgi:glycosyltransferase involved in cell wall biosynthesis
VTGKCTGDQKQVVGYLVSEYPAVSHTFILREVKALRGFGIEVFTASINKPKINFEMEEEESTHYIKQQGVIGVFRSFFNRLIKSPFKLFSGIKAACKLGMKNRFFYHLFYFAEALLVAEWAEKRCISHIHVHFMNNSSTIALLVKELTPVTISFTVHGPDSFQNCSVDFFKERVAAAKFVVCISHYAKSQVMNLVPYQEWKKLNVIRLGVDTDLYKANLVNTPSECIELLCVGRLTPAKGQHLIIEAIEILKREFSDFHMTFVGGGPDYDSLNNLVVEKELSRYVTFTGPLSEEETRRCFQQSDIFLLPSFAEGVPVVLMEAMATELPCITTYIAGIPELIENGENGILLYPGNAEEIVKSLKQLVFSSKKRSEIGKTARKKIFDQYSIKENTETLAQFFKNQLFSS